MSDAGWSRFTSGKGDLSLCTDLYQLTMAAAYEHRAGDRRGSFELTVRGLPTSRNFLVFAGLEQALTALGEIRFSDDQLAYLRGLPVFSAVGQSFFDRLARFHFRGDVWAMEEGTIFFPDEPVLRVSGDLIEAQIIETLLLSIINFQTAIASKAARLRLAAGDEVQLAEFGTRRAHGPQAALWAARAAFLAGFDSTSNVLAGQRLGIPVVGTMAHSFVMAAASERQAFLDYQGVFPEHSIFLVDTYDTLEGVARALDLGVPFVGVRLDSGDLDELSRRVRRLLDESGAAAALIFASGDVDEWLVETLRRRRAPIDAYGVGSKLSTSADAPYIGGVYKLVEIEEDGQPRPAFKSSTGKISFPGCKQVLRRSSAGTLERDLLVLAPGVGDDNEVPLLRPVMVRGELVEPLSLATARDRCQRDLAALPAALRSLDPALQPYSVQIGTDIEGLLAAARSARSEAP